MFEQVSEMVVDDVGRVAHLHSCNFLLELLQSTGLVKLNDFHCVYNTLVEF